MRNLPQNPLSIHKQICWQLPWFCLLLKQEDLLWWPVNTHAKKSTNIIEYLYVYIISKEKKKKRTKERANQLTQNMNRNLLTRCSLSTFLIADIQAFLRAAVWALHFSCSLPAPWELSPVTTKTFAWKWSGSETGWTVEVGVNWYCPFEQIC